MKRKVVLIVIAAVIGLACIMFFAGGKKQVKIKKIRPVKGDIAVEVRLNGYVAPRNRLEIKPQVSGRIEDVLVNEGARVKKGETLAVLSSTERAALIDSARAKGSDELKKWEDIYRPTPVISPINGFVISRQKEPGQSVTTGDIIVVLADELIVEADIDETDLRNVKLAQQVKIALDAYPDKSFDGVVEHIAYESTIISNVTVYNAKIRPLKVPEVFRSGMTATMELTVEKKEGVLTLPVDAVNSGGVGKYVLIKGPNGSKPEKRVVTTGISNGRDIEITSGLTEQDSVIMLKDAAAAGGGGRGMRGGMGSIFGVGGSRR